MENDSVCDAQQKDKYDDSSLYLVIPNSRTFKRGGDHSQQFEARKSFVYSNTG
jgi:hypothetical protein